MLGSFPSQSPFLPPKFTPSFLLKHTTFFQKYTENFSKLAVFLLHLYGVFQARDWSHAASVREQRDCRGLPDNDRAEGEPPDKESSILISLLILQARYKGILIMSSCFLYCRVENLIASSGFSSLR